MPLKRSYSVTSDSNYLDLTEYTINTDFLSSSIFWSILLTYFVFFKITLYGLHLLSIYGWNNLFPLVLIGWVNKKGRNWLKSPQIDYLLTFFNITYWCYFGFLNYLYWSKSKEVSFNHFYYVEVMWKVGHLRLI